jgi:biotin carboxylase
VNGKHRLLGVHDKLFFPPPSFAIRGGCFTPNGPELADIEAYVFRVLDVVGFDWGATHIELMMTAEGPRLIEINPRLVGAWMPRLVGLALGRSIHADLIDVHLGRWPDASPLAAPARIAVSRWFVAAKQGQFEKLLAPPPPVPGKLLIEVLRSAGSNVRPPLENADRIGYVMVSAASRKKAERLAEQHVSRSRVVLRSNTPISHNMAEATC